MSKRDPPWELKEETGNEGDVAEFSLAVCVGVRVSDCIIHMVTETVVEGEAANLRSEATQDGKFVDVLSSAEGDRRGDLVLWGLTKALQRTQGLSLCTGTETCKCKAIPRILSETLRPNDSAHRFL